MSQHQATKQFESVIKADLNRWFEESDLDVEQLTAAAVRAIEDWLDEDTVEFEPEDGTLKFQLDKDGNTIKE